MRDPTRGEDGASNVVLVPKSNRGDQRLLARLYDAATAALDGPGAGAAGGAAALSADQQGDALREVDEYGFPLDGYDYKQHLAPIGGGTFLSASGQVQFSAPLPSVDPSLLPSLERDEVPLDHMMQSVTVDDEHIPEDVRQALAELSDDDIMADDELQALAAQEEAGGAAAAGAVGAPDSTLRLQEMFTGKYEALNDDFLAQANGEMEAPEWDTTVYPEERGAAEFDLDAHIARLLAGRTTGKAGGASGVHWESDEECDEVDDSKAWRGAAGEAPDMSDFQTILAQYDDAHLGDGMSDSELLYADAHSGSEGSDSEGGESDEEQHAEPAERQQLYLGAYVPGIGRVTSMGLHTADVGLDGQEDEEATERQAEMLEAMAEQLASRQLDWGVSIRKAAGAEPDQIPYGFAEGDGQDKPVSGARSTAEQSVATYMQRRYAARSRWDAETVLTTLTNTENHPTQLGIPQRRMRRTGRSAASVASAASVQGGAGHGEDSSDGGPGSSSGGASAAFSVSLPPTITLSSKTGMPVFISGGSQSAVPASVPEHDEAGSYSGSDSDECEEALVIEPRDRHESKQDKRARKAAVKASKREARSAKKAMKLAFKEEQKALAKAGHGGPSRTTFKL